MHALSCGLVSVPSCVGLLLCRLPCSLRRASCPVLLGSVCDAVAGGLFLRFFCLFLVSCFWVPAWVSTWHTPSPRPVHTHATITFFRDLVVNYCPFMDKSIQTSAVVPPLPPLVFCDQATQTESTCLSSCVEDGVIDNIGAVFFRQDRGLFQASSVTLRSRLLRLSYLIPSLS